MWLYFTVYRISDDSKDPVYLSESKNEYDNSE